MSIFNVKITSTMLGPEDHGMMTFFIHLRGESLGIGYGGYQLDWQPSGASKPIPSFNGHAYEAIRHILDTLKVPRWEDLKGLLCRIEFDDGPGCSGKVLRIGHIIEDRWFDLSSYMKEGDEQ